MNPLIIDPPGGDPLGTIIFLHGLGANGYDFEPVARQLMPLLPMRWVLPHAPEMPVTLNNGWRMPAWFDIISLDKPNDVDWDSVDQAKAFAHKTIEREAAMTPRRLFIGGFSQGGAVSLNSAFDAPAKVDGVVALSTFLLQRPGETGLPRGLNPRTAPPVFMAHGTTDGIVPLHFAFQGKKTLENAGLAINWREYPMQHSVCQREIEDLLSWLSAICHSKG